MVGKKNQKNKFIKGVSTKQVSTIVKKTLLNNNVVELKKHRYQLNSNLSTTAQFYPLLNASAQGDSDLEQRIGNRIKLKSIRITGNLIQGDTYNIIRMVLFIWNDDNTSGKNPPVDGNIFDDTSTVFGRQYGELASASTNPSRKVIQVLGDKRVVLTATNNVKQFSFRKTFKIGKDVTFGSDSVSTGVGIPHLMIITDSSAITHPAVNFYSVCHYNDI